MASISDVSLWIMRFRSAISVLVALKSSPYLLADVCISSYYSVNKKKTLQTCPKFGEHAAHVKTFVHYLGLVPRLCLSPGAVGDVLILSLDFSHDGVHVQVAAVVHFHND